jgi:hypothetical protein
MRDFLRRFLSGLKRWYDNLAYSDLTREEARLVIERFLDDKSLDVYEWRDFLDYKFRDPIIEKARLQILAISVSHQPIGYGFCDAEGMKKIREVAKSLCDKSNESIL